MTSKKDSKRDGESDAKAVIVWFRQDLRVADNPALHAAAQTGLPVIPVYVWSPEAEEDWPYGAADRVWIDGSLRALSNSLEKMHSALVIRNGDPQNILIELAKAVGACTIHCNTRYEPAARALQKKLETAFKKEGLHLESHTGGTLLWEPEAIETNSGTPYQVFTPFYRKCLSQMPELESFQAPKTLCSPKNWPDSASVDDLKLRPTIQWDDCIRETWEPGEAAAQRMLKTFIEEKQDRYGKNRDIPAVDGTSCLSPYLRHGEISPRQIWLAVLEDDRPSGKGFLRELVWREFAYHVLFHFPHTTHQALKDKFSDLPWKLEEEHFKRWTQGQTGYPLVDAGMRQLWRTGWMHNRIRMVVGSFLTKDLMISWLDGARWFWDTLVDADLAQNSLNWQWVGGCGADAQPFFRIFNPVTQSKKFDPNGEYIRQWVPELAKLPNKYIHEPWNAPPLILRDAGITLGTDYPEPIVDHGAARDTALKAYKAIG